MRGLAKTCLIMAACLSQLADSMAEDSLQWRGSDGQGHSTAKNLPITWSETSNVAWKTEIPGRGWSTPVVQGNDIWLTTAIEFLADEKETAERLKANTGDQPLVVLQRVELRALCVDRKSGQIKQNVLLIDKKSPQWVHKLNSYASPSPVLEGERLYCCFGAYGSACLNTSSGQLVWTNSDLEVMHENGPGGSPVVIGDRVIVHMDGSDRQFIAALDKYTGKLAWKTDRSGEMESNPQLRKSYGTPLAMTLGGKLQVVSPATNWFVRLRSARWQRVVEVALWRAWFLTNTTSRSGQRSTIHVDWLWSLPDPGDSTRWWRAQDLVAVQARRTHDAIATTSRQRVVLCERLQRYLDVSGCRDRQRSLP